MSEQRDEAKPGEGIAPENEETALVELPSGRTVEVHRGPNESLTIYHPTGQVEVSISLTEDGPVLSMAAAAINMRTSGDLNISCDRFRVRSRSSVDIRTDGDMVQQVGGNATTEVEGVALTAAHSVGVAAREGDLDLEADSDVLVNGNRVLINS